MADCPAPARLCALRLSHALYLFITSHLHSLLMAEEHTVGRMLGKHRSKVLFDTVVLLFYVPIESMNL